MASVEKICEQALYSRLVVAVPDTDVSWDLFHDADTDLTHDLPKILLRVHPNYPEEYGDCKRRAEADIHITSGTTEDPGHSKLESMYERVREVIDDTAFSDTRIDHMYAMAVPGGQADIELDGYQLASSIFLPLDLHIVVP